MKIKTIRLPTRDTPETRAYAEAVEGGLKMYHIYFHDSGKWIVRTLASKKPLAVFDTKSEAKTHGAKLAKAHKTELIVHKKDGFIQKRVSYEDDSL